MKKNSSLEKKGRMKRFQIFQAETKSKRSRILQKQQDENT